MKHKIVGLILVCASLAGTTAYAHHSFAAEYDGNAKLTLKGTIAKIDWMNPHIWIYIDAKDEAGKVTRWQCEGGPPNSLTRNGWTKDAVKIGDEVTIEGFRAKDGTNTCNSRSIDRKSTRLNSSH